MIAGLSGSLLSESALEKAVPDALRGLLGEPTRSAARRRLRRWHLLARATLGPSAGARTVFDTVAAPLLGGLGYDVVPDTMVPLAGSSPPSQVRCVRALLLAGGRRLAALVVTGWGQDAGAAWRDAVRHGIASTVRWCFCLTGPSLRVIDSERTYSRRFIAFDLDTAIDDERTFGVLWGLLRAEAMAARSTRRREPPGTRDRHQRGTSGVGSQLAAAGRRRGAGASPEGFRRGPPRQSSNPRRTGARKHIRRVVDRHLPHPLPALRRGPRPGSALASRLPRRLHHRVPADADRAAAAAARPVGNDAIDRTAGASRVPRRLAARDSLQRPPVLACRLAAGRARAARRRRGAAGAAGVDDAAGSGWAGAHLVRGSRRRTTGRRLRARARSGAGNRRPAGDRESFWPCTGRVGEHRAAGGGRQRDRSIRRGR